MAYCFNDDKSKKSILDAVYPVGAIYMSVNNTSPETLFGGGTWERIQGRFLVGAGSNGASGNQALNVNAGTTGGETNHTLTTSEMPSHRHTTTFDERQMASGTGAWPITAYTPQGSGPFASRESMETGGGQSHNNLPPYLSVYMWKRTA